MITCKLKGGLGNMLFQIATTTALALDNADHAVFDFKSHRANQGHKPKRYRETIFRKLVHQRRPKTERRYEEPHFHYAPISYDPALGLEGYFQSERYFAGRRDEILELFAPTDAQVGYLREKYGLLLAQQPTSLHVRRGDYVKLADHHPTVPLAYYEHALDELSSDGPCLVFSDDPSWCRETFSDPRFVLVSETTDELEVYLMSMCHHHIIANSSFSWWGSWLDSRGEGRVIAPKTWFGPAFSEHDTNDLIPDHWTRMEAFGKPTESARDSNTCSV